MHLFFKHVSFGSTLMNLLEQHFSANTNLDIIFTVKSNAAAAAAAAADYNIS